MSAPAVTHPPVWPLKRRELRNDVMDSTRWNGFRFRDGDVVIGTWGKSGTTWMQQIVGQLIFDAADDVPTAHLSPWIDFRLGSVKRFTPPDPDLRRYYHTWLERDGYPAWPFWSHVQSWWDLRTLPNVLLVHFADLKADLPREIRRVARFLDIPLDDARLPKIVDHCSFDYMKNALGGDRRSARLVNVGTNGRWRDVLSTDEIAKCDTVAAANLTPDCARWLRTGQLPS